MAVFPCDWSAHRYVEPQQSVYVISAFGSDVETVKLRLCPRHFRQLQELVKQNMALVDDDSHASMKCDACDDDRVFAVYAKVFAQGEEPVYYATDLCAADWDTLRDVLHVASGHPLAGR